MLAIVFACYQTVTMRRGVASQREAQHYPKHTARCELLDRFAFARVTHGGPLGCPAKTAPGAGNCLYPASVATTLSMPAWQHGHCMTAILVTRAMNACADSAALGFDAGICSASLACASLSVLHALANTP